MSEIITASNKNYRYDIDGLRAIAVIAVFIFHAGYLPNGFLGVDVFFVISGYLITRILYAGRLNNSFSLRTFYVKRVRRIIPLVLFFCLLALLLGICVMLPDDLENLSQSIIATIGFANNILLSYTTENYWDVLNEFKPLMHTWSLGIEEQFYLFYPLFFLFFRTRKSLFPVLLLLTILSVGMYFQSIHSASFFYLLPFRFFELSIGGLAAILLVYRQILFRFKFLFLVVLLYLICWGLPAALSKVQILLTCITTLLLLITTDINHFCDKLLQNKVMVGIGKISFSMYMWHQVLLAYTRYFLVQELTIFTTILLFIATILLSILTYKIIETPFRNSQIINNQMLFGTIIFTSLLVLLTSFCIYFRAGVIRDVPELNISASKYERNMHSKYMMDVNRLPTVFSNTNKTKILVYGNSFAGDWTNVLLESKYKDKINVVCVSFIEKHLDLAKEADIIFLAKLSKTTNPSLAKSDLTRLEKAIQKKIWCVGTKNFGISNGIIYNFQGDQYCTQRTKMEAGYLEENSHLKKEWGEKYIDIVGLFIDKAATVPVFTPDCKLISHDTRHLTPSGAKYIATLVENQLDTILEMK